MYQSDIVGDCRSGIAITYALSGKPVGLGKAVQRNHIVPLQYIGKRRNIIFGISEMSIDFIKNYYYVFGIFDKKSSSTAFGIYVPVGLLGLVRKMILVRFVMAFKMPAKSKS